MKVPRAGLLVCAALVLAALPGASACIVTPIMDMDFPDNPRCPRFSVEGCIPLPPVGESVSFPGTLSWQWDTPGCGDSAIPRDEVTITFEPLRQNPSWMELSVEPESITVGPEDYLQTGIAEPDAAIGTMRFTMVFDIEVTWRRTGSPSPAAVEDIGDSGGQALAFARARSLESGDFRESTTVEQFLFDAIPLMAPAAEPDEDAPLPVAGLTVLLLACLAALRRRT